ncbi:MAG: ATPase [Oceanicaulis sp.]|nr:ATPase [Oceanicaulis sp.]
MQALRLPIGYVVEVNGSAVVVNLNDSVRSHVSGHQGGISSFEQPGDLVAVTAGADTIVARVQSLCFAEPRETHRFRSNVGSPPLRQLRATVIGVISRDDQVLEFTPRDSRLPALGAEAFPLSGEELRAVVGQFEGDAGRIVFGMEARNPSLRVSTSLNALLSRHMAVLGATGQGKTHYVADIIQQIAENYPRARVVIFDVNGEYYPAFRYLEDKVKYIAVGARPGRNAPHGAEVLKLPYYALGRHGLFRLLLPSEKTQAPALRFAINHLDYVESNGEAAKPVGQLNFTLFDDCRPGDASSAKTSLDAIQSRVRRADRWPHFRALSCLAAEFHSLENRGNDYRRSAFLYSNVSALINRIHGYISDTRFQDVIDIEGGAPAGGGALDMAVETSALVGKIFGNYSHEENDPSITVIDLSQLTQDLMPFVLGSLLEMLAEQIFLRGPRNTHPTLLVLEEAHHYLRQLQGDAESGQHALAYERLPKEGRKFGLSLLVSTQRPSEVSPTVLAQCGTWSVFRLTNEADKRAVASAAEGAAESVTSQISGLARGEAMLFGSALPLPIRLQRIPLAEDRQPDSLDPPFKEEWSAP